ncbi:unnamed protein product [Rotaria magnacalcarata]|uniref:Uncharacterized protein n=1 Tax=Rotaria magnacalcarata TaxID=392030 RepID=A0A816UF32_9BILA|nr:unnamed protein product [Rotaria magnacalcarata]
MMKIVLVFHLFLSVKGSFHLYNTKKSDNRDYKDCLYSFTSNIPINEWQLVPYCIRHNLQTFDDDGLECDTEADYTFAVLKSKNTNSLHLYTWNAPIDTINDYQKYLSGGDLSLAGHHYCNCSANWFGTRCQYSFDQSIETMTFDEIIMSQFKRKQPLSDTYEIVNDPSMLTCYEGLRCHSTICLDWRQICDRNLNCENGEDEPDECILLETNECKNDEYRCQYGTCIPKTFLIDFSYECMDLSDENNNKPLYCDSHCYVSPSLFCDFHFGDALKFSCGDGEFTDFYEWRTSCNNGRDLFLRRNLLLAPTPNDTNNLTNISSECWFFMLCINRAKHKTTKLFDLIHRTCECSSGSVEESRCLTYFRKHCPTSFFFQTPWNPLYPFIRFLYHNIPNYSSKWWYSTHACYNQSHCLTFPFSGLPLIDGLVCITHDRENVLYSDASVQQIFSACSIPYTPMLADDRRLFYCNKSMKLISKHRVQDDISDCYYMEDNFIAKYSSEGKFVLDDEDASIMRNFNLTDRFKCNTTDEWLPRWTIGVGNDSACGDKSDKLYLGSCKVTSDIGCQFLRGLYSPPVFYVFQENCNSVLKLYFPVKNETDETNCEEWSSI